MYSPIDCSAVVKAVTDELARLARNTVELNRRLLGIDASLRFVLPSTDVNLAEFSFQAATLVLQRGLERSLPAMVKEFPDSARRLERLALLLGFLRALLQLPELGRLAHTVAAILAPDLPSKHDLLAQLIPGPHLVEPLGAAILERVSRADADPRAALVRLAQGLLAEAHQARIDVTPLREWLQDSAGVLSTTSSPALRVLSLRLVSIGTGGWTVHWLRAVSPGRKIVNLKANQSIANIDALWSVLNLATARLVKERFVESADQLILRVEVESDHALDSFHRATYQHNEMQLWEHFHAVTVWPRLEGGGEDNISGYRYTGPLHRPTAGVPSETVALHCESIEIKKLRACVGKRVMLVCTEPVWRRGPDGRSPALNTHMERTLSALLVGDDAQSFLNCLFADDLVRPFHDVFRAAHAWLDAGKDIHILWTDPDYHADPTPLEMLP